MTKRTHLKVFGGALVAFVYAVAGLFLLAAWIGQANAIPVLFGFAAVMATSTAYGATVLLRALIGTLREDRRRELECSECRGTGYSGDSAVGTGLYNGGEK